MRELVPTREVECGDLAVVGRGLACLEEAGEQPTVHVLARCSTSRSRPQRQTLEAEHILSCLQIIYVSVRMCLEAEQMAHAGPNGRLMPDNNENLRGSYGGYIGGTHRFECVSGALANSQRTMMSSSPGTLLLLTISPSSASPSCVTSPSTHRHTSDLCQP